LKRIAQSTGLSPSGVRKKLVREGIYQGLSREFSRTRKGITASEDGSDRTEAEFPPLQTWESKNGAYVRVIDGVGWGIGLPSGFDAWIISPVLPAWAGRGLEFSSMLAGVESLVIGIRDENSMSEINCLFQGGVESRWHVRHPCSSAPRLFFRSNNYQRSAAAVSGISLKEVSAGGLKASALPVTEEKKVFKPGDKIDLMDSLRSDSSRISSGAAYGFPNALQIDLVGEDSIYAPLPPETAGRAVCFTATMRSLSGDATMDFVLADGEGKEKEVIQVRSKSSTWELTRKLERNSGVQIRCREGGRTTILLEQIEIEIVE